MGEHCVQTMKASLIKTIEEGEDVDLALLNYTPKSQTAITSRITELKEVQDSATNPYSTNKTARKLQTNHGPRKASTGTTLQ